MPIMCNQEDCVMKSGFIAIVGKPNAGKSTLLNSLLSKKVAITTHKAQTTRNAILGILNKKDYQIVFIDTPGIHNPNTHLGTYMNKEAYNQAFGADIIYYIVDGNSGIRSEDKQILDRLFEYDVPIFLLVNKIDEISKNKLIERLNYAANSYNFKEIIPISALNKDNLDDLISTSLNYLNDSVLYYPSDIETLNSLEFQIAEIIREKIILNTEQEIPHLSAVKIDTLKQTDRRITIEATIIVNKDSHKAIIIGKSGSMLKKINTQSSIDIKKLTNKKVFLSLYVRVEEDWLNKDKKLFDLGYFLEK